MLLVSGCSIVPLGILLTFVRYGGRLLSTREYNVQQFFVIYVAIIQVWVPRSGGLLELTVPLREDKVRASGQALHLVSTIMTITPHETLLLIISRHGTVKGCRESDLESPRQIKIEET